MENMELFIAFCIAGFVVAVFMLWYLDKCIHDWEMIDKGDIKSSNNRSIGHYEIHRCSKCKKLKKESVRIPE